MSARIVIRMNTATLAVASFVTGYDSLLGIRTTVPAAEKFYRVSLVVHKLSEYIFFLFQRIITRC